MNEIDSFIENALSYLDSCYKKNLNTNLVKLSEVYPYIFEKFNIDVTLTNHENENMFDYLGILYESSVPINIRKDLGQFYTNDDDVINLMIDSVDLFSGKILEPSCGSGRFGIYKMDM